MGIFNHIDWKVVGLGFSMAAIDSVVFPFMKLYKIGDIKSLYFMIGASLIYSIEPWLFLKSLQYETMTIMNLYWDLASDLLITLIGIFIFKEQIGFHKKIGMMFSVIALFFMSYEDLKVNN